MENKASDFVNEVAIIKKHYEERIAYYKKKDSEVNEKA